MEKGKWLPGGEYLKLVNQAYGIGDMFLADYYAIVRESVRESDSKMTGKEEVYLGYVYKTADGKYEKYYISGGIENAARFICSSDDDKLLCGSDDYPLLCSIGDYLDLIQCEDGVKDKLIAELKKYQGAVGRPEFELWRK